MTGEPPPARVLKALVVMGDGALEVSEGVLRSADDFEVVEKGDSELEVRLGIRPRATPALVAHGGRARATRPAGTSVTQGEDAVILEGWASSGKRLILEGRDVTSRALEWIASLGTPVSRREYRVDRGARLYRVDAFDGARVNLRRETLDRYARLAAYDHSRLTLSGRVETTEHGEVDVSAKDQAVVDGGGQGFSKVCVDAYGSASAVDFLAGDSLMTSVVDVATARLAHRPGCRVTRHDRDPASVRLSCLAAPARAADTPPREEVVEVPSSPVEPDPPRSPPKSPPRERNRRGLLEASQLPPCPRGVEIVEISAASFHAARRPASRSPRKRKTPGPLSFESLVGGSASSAGGAATEGEDGTEKRARTTAPAGLRRQDFVAARATRDDPNRA